MTVANDSITITPGAGATVATHTANAKEHQVVITADEYGYLTGSAPTYRCFVPKQAVGANKVYFDVFNATGSGKTLKLIAVVPIVSGAVAVNTNISVDLFLTRTSSIGTGGTEATNDGSSLTAMTFTRQNTNDGVLPVEITGRLSPTGGASADAVLSFCSVFAEETNAASYFGNTNNMATRDGSDSGVFVSENSGFRIVQGAVASAGNIGFDIIFSVL